jgi:DNA-binding response OmpR family regulator
MGKERQSPEILVVDDDAAIVELLGILLKSENYKVSGFTDSLEAWEYLQQHHQGLSLAIIDLMMSPKSGLELMRDIRDINQTLPMMVVTAYYSEIPAVKKLGAPASAFIRKPFAIGEFLEKVHELADPKKPSRPRGHLRIIPNPPSQ